MDVHNFMTIFIRCYVGETGRPLATRIREHRKEEVENSIKTRQPRKQIKIKIVKSAITDHALHNEHPIDWEQTHVKDKETIRFNSYKGVNTHHSIETM